MPTAFVLMTAMPPTVGHMNLIKFATHLAPETRVIVCTQPGEPFVRERFFAIKGAVDDLNDNGHGNYVEARWFDRTIEQNPEAPGFWDTWRKIMTDYGFQPGDYIVASEPYGQRLAQEVGGVFMPYDMDRSIRYSKATDVRFDPLINFDLMIPEFQRYLTKTITIFGAESTGKTTLTYELAKGINGHRNTYTLFEWARPYLENVGTEITTESMTAIWKGQWALQAHVKDLPPRPFVIQDTDLFSTVGYWDFWDMNTPQGLINDAIKLKSDLYIITRSNIPFEEDPIRYGGDKRESDDQYWIDLCERYGLNYVVLDDDVLERRVSESYDLIAELFYADNNMEYKRSHNE